MFGAGLPVKNPPTPQVPDPPIPSSPLRCQRWLT